MSFPGIEAGTLASDSRECQPATPAATRTSTLVATALFVTAVAWIVWYPHVLGESDEALVLYEAARLLHGDLFYRDMFEIITPGTQYVLALFFALLGTTFAAARLATALVHGTIVLLVYRGSRALGARPGLAAVAGVAHVAAGFPAWPYASPHWLGTLLTLAVLVILIEHPHPRRRVTLALGVILGLLVTVQQQKVPAIAAGTAIVLAVQYALDRPPGGSWRPLLARLGMVAAGGALVVVPFLLFVLATAGFEEPFNALVRHTVYYRSVARIGWGGIGYWNKNEAANSFPQLLGVAPIALGLVAAARLIAAALTRDGLRRRRKLLTVAIFLAFAAASVAYFPDFIHLAFIAPVVWMLAAETVEWVLDTTLSLRRARVVGGVATAAALVAVVLHLQAVRARTQATHPIVHDTPIGRIAFRKQSIIDFVERARTRLADAGATEVYTHPGYTSLYLLLGVRNATRFQMAAPGYNSPAELEEIIAVLGRKQLPYLIVIPALAKRNDDPVVAWILEHYELDGEPDLTAGPVLLRRKAPAVPPAPPL
jgi:hypothetical protein